MRSTLLLSSVLLNTLAVTAAAQQTTQPFMGQPVPGLTAAELDLFLKGRDDFIEPLTTADGLGPIFNEPACASCHNHPAVGGSGTREVTRFGRAASGGNPFDPLDNLGGSLLQDQSEDLNCREVVPPEADVIANRLTPICFGAGLLTAIDDADILNNEANQPPGLNGFASLVGDVTAPGDPPRPARFGWKGDALNAIAFSVGAGLNEMGLTSPLAPEENAPNGDQTKLAACDTVPDPEDHPDADGITHVQHWTSFQRGLAAPAQTPRSGMMGDALFTSVGCADCHRPSYLTTTAPEPALSGVTILPYSDFLVHDMSSLGDQIVQANASETQMFTRALWGLASRDSFLHDGRITGGTFHDLMVQVVQEHDGEGAASRTAFNALSPTDQAHVTDFLHSLGQTEFDFELDNDLDEFDWFFIQPWVTGPVGGTITPDDAEAITDVDQDGDFDLVEFGMLQRSFTGQVVSPDPPPTPPSTRLHTTVRSGGNNVWVAPGGDFYYEVRGLLSNGHTDGLAMFSFDLSLDSGALPPMIDPQAGSMLQFLSPAGLNNPAGFGGTPFAGDLLQVGGAMNTINNTFAPTPNGTVVTGIAQGASQILARGRATAPSTPGTYDLELFNLFASAIEQGSTGSPFYPSVAIEQGLHRDLTIIVENCAPEVYCTGKLTSMGCTPQMQWKGRPSATGRNDFHLWTTNLPGSETGLILFSITPGNTPFFGGTLCLGGTIKRTPGAATGGASDTCEGSLDYHMTQGYMAAKGLIPGTRVYAQAWFRDSGHPDGTGIGLSDAIEFEICP